ncbi:MULTISPECIES: hypothetical protein [unclassified Microcystis]|uniref:hypothetical protein n=1 Tax=unclassified Microcystis TaxID=2643300 RepID=UPI00257C0404|nr:MULTISPECIES: hypothetical protein [unclassified Microcystis]MCA2762878.1 hypothetical protein [Microcystis sp. M151S2]MCA2915858.1 hypothetical protein [Microcystis sp. M022S1]MCA2927743.1 hypothetical protein [Microcystis sp. M020S1]MCA2934461.1 hypothetical protein [Microcystis sp. M015S1]MCA2618043.1 hypothetical protein [Microcystis sp. M099S2]
MITKERQAVSPERAKERVRWGNGGMGEWGDHFVRVAGGNGEFQIKPQHPNTLKP